VDAKGRLGVVERAFLVGENAVDNPKLVQA
jgi:hypothetical protein